MSGGQVFSGPVAIDEDEVEEEELGHAETYSDYKPTKRRSQRVDIVLKVGS